MVNLSKTWIKNGKKRIIQKSGSSSILALIVSVIVLWLLDIWTKEYACQTLQRNFRYLRANSVQVAHEVGLWLIYEGYTSI